MPYCGNCESFITDDYARVFTPEDCEQPRCCPNCELTRDGSGVREMRGQSSRSDFDETGQVVTDD